MFILENGAAFNRTQQLSTDYKYKPAEGSEPAEYSDVALIRDNNDGAFYIAGISSDRLLQYSYQGSSSPYFTLSNRSRQYQIYNIDTAHQSFDIQIDETVYTGISYEDLNDLYNQIFTHFSNNTLQGFVSDYSVLYVGKVYIVDDYDTTEEESPSYIGYNFEKSITTDNVYYDSDNYLWHKVEGYTPSGIKYRPYYYDFNGNKAYVAPLYIQIYDMGQTSNPGEEINIIFKDYDRSGESVSSEEYIQVAGYSVYTGELNSVSLRFYSQSTSTYWQYYIDNDNLHKVEYNEGTEVSDTDLGAYSDAKVLEEISTKYVYGSRGELILLTSNLIKSNGWMSQALSDEEEPEPEPPTPTNRTIYRRRNGVLKEIIPIEDERTDGGLVAYNEEKDSLETVSSATLANLNVTDTATINHATIVTEEDIHSEADFIELRVNNPLPTPSTGAGIQINNYDGNGNDLNLITMSDGTLRLGEPGYEEPILTRDEATNLRNGAPLVWDAANLKAVSSYTTDGNKVLKSVKNSTTGVVTYEWSSSGSGAVWRGTQAELATALLITDPNDENYIPNNAMIIITDADEEYLNEEVQ